MFDKVSRAKDYACIEVEGSRDQRYALILNRNSLIESLSIRPKSIFFFYISVPLISEMMATPLSVQCRKQSTRGIT